MCFLVGDMLFVGVFNSCSVVSRVLHGLLCFKQTVKAGHFALCLLGSSNFGEDFGISTQTHYLNPLEDQVFSCLLLIISDTISFDSRSNKETQ